MKAFELFHNLRTWRGMKPDEVLFTVMIKACEKNNEAERALNLLDDLRTSRLYPTDITYRELIKVMAMLLTQKKAEALVLASLFNP